LDSLKDVSFIYGFSCLILISYVVKIPCSSSMLIESRSSLSSSVDIVGMFYRQYMLVIDGKYNNDNDLSTGRVCQVGTRIHLGRRCSTGLTR
jgi:hypothetical protein